MRLLPALAAALFAVVGGGGSAAEDAGQPEVFAAVFELRDEQGQDDGYYCSPDLPDDAICLGSSILIQKGVLVRYLGEKPPANDPKIRKARGADVYGKYVRFRMIGRHAAMQVEPGRYVAVLEPTENGYLFVQWKEALTHGRPCLPGYIVEHYGSRLSLPVVPEEPGGSVCF